MARRRQASRSRAGLLFGAVLVVTTGCGAPAPVATGASSHSRAPSAAEPTPTPTPRPPLPTANLPATTDLTEAGATAFTIGPAPDFVVAADGFAFMSAAGGGTGHVAKVDSTGKIVEEYDVPGGSCGAMDVGFGAIWTMTCPGPGMGRIDLETNAILPIAVGLGVDSEASLGAGEGAVWMMVTGVPRKLVKVDGATGAILASYPIEGLPTAVRAGEGGVWITDPVANVVHRFDPAQEKVIATVPVGQRPQFIAVGEGALWTMDQVDGTVTRVDAASNTRTATIRLAAPIEGGDIAVGGGFVWVQGNPTLLYKIDPATNTVVAVYGPPSGSGSVAADDDAMWVTAHDVQKVWRLPLR